MQILAHKFMLCFSWLKIQAFISPIKAESTKWYQICIFKKTHSNTKMAKTVQVV